MNRYRTHLIFALLVSAWCPSIQAQTPTPTDLSHYELQSRKAILPAFSHPTSETLIAAAFVPMIYKDSDVDPHWAEKGYHARLIVALFDSGRLLWSNDPILGGPPYRQATIPIARFEEFRADLVAAKDFDNPSLYRARHGFHANFSVLYIKGTERPLYMASWDEYFESKPGFAGTSHGVVKLVGPHEGKTKEQILAEEKDQDYLAYRRKWTEIKERLRGLIPRDGVEPAKDVPDTVTFVHIPIWIQKKGS